ncbi:hypothetical protein ABVT39_000587 [Epinephelus coioides]
MAKLSAAEKQKRYRERRDADPERIAEYLQKRKQGYAKDIEMKKRKKINQLTEGMTHQPYGLIWTPFWKCLQIINLMSSTFMSSVMALPRNVMEQHHSGQWCAVGYDDDPYPGIILEVEEHNVKVKWMHRNGINKFFWPSLREDVNWYEDDQIMCLIPEPLPVSKRSVEIDQGFWEFIIGQLDNY